MWKELFAINCIFLHRMGLLTEGSPLSWEETKQHADHVRSHGVTQLLHIYHRLKETENDCLKWGDEVRYYEE